MRRIIGGKRKTPPSILHPLLTSLWFGLSPIDTVTPHGLLTLRNCFLDFAVEHWFGCRATEPGFAGDIGAIEVWLIDWFLWKWLHFYRSRIPTLYLPSPTFCIWNCARHWQWDTCCSISSWIRSASVTSLLPPLFLWPLWNSHKLSVVIGCFGKWSNMDTEVIAVSFYTSCPRESSLPMPTSNNEWTEICIPCMHPFKTISDPII